MAIRKPTSVGYVPLTFLFGPNAASLKTEAVRATPSRLPSSSIRRKPVFPLQNRPFEKGPGQPCRAHRGRQRQKQIRGAARADLDQRIEQSVSDGRRPDAPKAKSV